LGAWYRKDEIGRRGGVYYLGVPLGQLTAGLLQASILKHLNGHFGIAGWRWNFIICGVITIPIGIFGFLIWPGTPVKGSSFFLTPDDYALARRRLLKAGHRNEATNPFTIPKLKKVFGGWKIYVLSIWDILFWNVSINTSAYLLWLKSVYGAKGPGLVRANNLSSTAPGLGIALVLFCNFGADLSGKPWLFVVLANTGVFISALILAIWPPSRSAKFFAFNIAPFSYAQSSVLYGWSNAILRRDQEERAIVLIVMNALAQVTSAFVPLGTYPTVQAPRYKRGYIFSTGIAAVQISFTFVVLWFAKRDERKYAAEHADSESVGESVKEPIAGENDDVAPPALAEYIAHSKLQ